MNEPLPASDDLEQSDTSEHYTERTNALTTLKHALFIHRVPSFGI